MHTHTHTYARTHTHTLTHTHTHTYLTCRQEVILDEIGFKGHKGYGFEAQKLLVSELVLSQKHAVVC